LAPENTMAAFRRAVDDGADGLEFDVQLSSDGQPVVIHDETLGRTTNGEGWVKDHTVAELMMLDASAGQGGFADARIPQLAEVLELVAAAGIKANIELKNSVLDYPGMEEIVLAAVGAAGLSEMVVYSSFSHASVRRIATLAPLAEVGLIYTRPLARPLRTAVSLGATAVHPDRRLVHGAGWITRAHRRHLKVRAWVVNSPKKMLRLADRGVDGIFTDHPAVARAAGLGG
jgi:glycerophosphoryl diester phosphodiesterase